MLRKFLSSLAFLSLLLFTSACTSDTVSYSLSSVLPSPVKPGETATAFGTLPTDAQLRLGDTLVIGTPVSGGIQFTVPEWMVAGTQSLDITAGKQTLTGVVQVLPRIDRVELSGQQLSVYGAGWPSTPTATEVSLEVSGVRVSPELAPGQLTATLPEGSGYGALTVRVKVGEQLSEAYSLQREAGAVTGRVIFPATGTDESPLASAQIVSTQINDSSLTALNVFHTEDLNLEGFTGLERADALPELGVTRLEFSTHPQAQAARDTLTSLVEVTATEWDAPVHTDGFEVQSVEAPALPGEGQWFLDLIGLEPAWVRTQGEGIVVAVIDTGVALDHPDLKSNLLPGYDFVDNDTEPYDLAGHGTHVAGLIAANGQVLGTAPEASLLPVRVLEGTSGGSAFGVAQGILWAAGLLEEPANPNPAQVINLSLGSSGYTSVIASAVAQAQAEGIVIVAATGNAGGPLAYPAALPGVISVTALAGPELAYQPWYANKGKGTWLTAYGGDTSQDQNGDGVADGILSTDADGYGLRMGTSMASPQVAGLAALALASGTAPHLVRDALAGTATELGTMGYDASFGYGLATGRVGSSSDPRSYVVALDSSGEPLSWTLVQQDGSFELSNLPPGQSLILIAMSDEDGDGILAEAGELFSSSHPFTATDGEVTNLSDLTLTPSDGTTPFTLEARH